ncbi:MAG: LytTr protein [Anaerocolumna sp.]|jgi:DNA-binding LytR/AlgR family response regulator|nr:LytTr protein [Anaerocolumna sp.]
MKVTINQNMDCGEEEIIINCSYVDERLKGLIELIRQYSFSMELFNGNESYHIPLESILYFDSANGRTFAYTTDKIYEAKDSLFELESKLKATPYVRISKNCILNTTYLVKVQPIVNHRLEATLKNNEKVIVSRNYISVLRVKLLSRGGGLF